MNKLIIDWKEIPLSDETVKAIKEGLKEERKSRKPKDWDEYYYIDDQAKALYNTWIDDGILIWNYYKTKEEADKKIEWLKAVERVKEYIFKEFGTKDFARWEDDYYLYYYYASNKIRYGHGSCIRYYSPVGYLESEDDCEKLIANCNDDLLIIFKEK